jgi:hypothetical protein
MLFSCITAILTVVLFLNRNNIHQAVIAAIATILMLVSWLTLRKSAVKT